MLALNNLPKYENEKITKILKPWLNVMNDYLIILLLTVPVFVGGIELATGRFVCVPVVDCFTTNNDSTPLSKYKYHNVCTVYYSFQKPTDINGKTKTVVTKLEYAREYDYVNSVCGKTAFPWFHSYFSSFLFGQAFILLLVNNLWLKNPWTTSIVNSFYALAEECYNLPGAHLAKLAQKNESTTTLPDSRESVPLNEFLLTGSQRNIAETDSSHCEGEDSVGVDLATAVAVKTVYDKIKRFNDHIETSTKIKCFYLLQAVEQVLLTTIFCFLNVWFKTIKRTEKCSVDEFDEYFPIIYDYFTCSHNLSKLLEQAWVVFLCILALTFSVCTAITCLTIKKLGTEYCFEDQLNEWRIPSDLNPAKRDMGFLLHLLHAYDNLYAVQFAIYMSEEHSRKFYTVILDNEWPVEKLERCLYKDKTALSLRGLSGIPNSLFQFDENSLEKLRELHINGCGPLQPNDFGQFEKFKHLSTLSLINCGLTKIPEALFKLESLKTLQLRNNSIMDIQNGIYDLRNLSNLDVSSNKLKSINISINLLRKLENVNISDNPEIHITAISNVLQCTGLKTLTVSHHSSIFINLSADDKEKFTVVAREDEHL